VHVVRREEVRDDEDQQRQPPPPGKPRTAAGVQRLLAARASQLGNPHRANVATAAHDTA
jgi:hypothetical protein